MPTNLFLITNLQKTEMKVPTPNERHYKLVLPNLIGFTNK